MPGPSRAMLDWQHHGMVFREVSDRHPVATIDGDSQEGVSPMDAMLLALAGCTASDVVEIVAKKRITMNSLRVEAVGDRREDFPRRYVKLHFIWHVDAPGATEAAFRQAIDLSLEKYCSATNSLNPDIPISYEIRLQA